MSDPKYGEPVDETPDTSGSQGVDDVVGSANESLADAEAASNDAVTTPEPAASDLDVPAQGVTGELPMRTCSSSAARAVRSSIVASRRSADFAVRMAG